MGVTATVDYVGVALLCLDDVASSIPREFMTVHCRVLYVGVISLCLDERGY